MDAGVYTREATLGCIGRFTWEQTNLLEGHSVATIEWDIPATATAGTYRIQHFGYHQPLSGEH